MAQIDLDLPLVSRILVSLDVVLRDLHAQAEQSRDPDGIGLLDQIESVVGLGFVASQTYITSRLFGRSKGAALACGPLLGGLHIAVVINAAANYWKHHSEWPSDENHLVGQPKATADLLRDAGVWQQDYKLTNLLHALIEPSPLRLEALLPCLRAWRDALNPGSLAPA